MADDLELSPKIETYRRMLERHPDSRVFVALAEEYRVSRMHEEAIAVLQEGLQRHPNYLSARVALARAHLESGAAIEAQIELERVVQSAPDNLFANRTLAELYERAGRLDLATERYRAVVALAPEDAIAQDRLAKLEVAQGAREEELKLAPTGGADIGEEPSVETDTPITTPGAPQPAGYEPRREDPSVAGEGKLELELDLETNETDLELPTQPSAESVQPSEASEPAPVAEPSPDVQATRVTDSKPAFEESFTTETLGDLYLQQRHRERAVEIFRRLLQADPTNQGLQAKLEAALAIGASRPRAQLERWLLRAQQLQRRSG